MSRVELWCKVNETIELFLLYYEESRGSDMGYTLYIAGVRGSRTVCGADFLEFGGETSCYVITDGNYALVIDCGSGLSNIKDYIKDCTKIDIVLTHIHYDHIVGLLDFDVFPKGVKPRVFGTYPKWNMYGKRRAFTAKPYWPVPVQYRKLIDVDWGDEVYLGLHVKDEETKKEDVSKESFSRYAEDDKTIRIKFFEANHPDSCSMLRIEVNHKKIMLMCDYEHGKPVPEEMMVPFDILIYDGMYIDEEYEKFKGYGHSTMEKGIILAKEMGVKQLILTHHDPKKNDEVLRELEKKAKENFHNVSLARRGDQILL